ncbi:MAG: integrase [Pseudomonadales bacterium]|nr:integrase [Pseudomonadales bacterium]
MSRKRVPPTPILDDLESFGNPFKRMDFNTQPFFNNQKPVVGSQIDYEYALKFLYSYEGSKATFNAYRRELERLLQWCWRIEERSILLMKREDIEEYIKFCINPPLSWIGTKSTSRFLNVEGERVPNKEWRPFLVTVGKDKFRKGVAPDRKDFILSQAAIKGIFTALSSFYDFLTQEMLLDANPIKLIRQKSKYIVKSQKVPDVRRISDLQWEYVIEAAEQLADDDPDSHERTLFAIYCLFSMYLRISELVADTNSIPYMSDFKRDHTRNWWFHVTGKGNKYRKITVCDEMLSALKRYRRFRGLSSLPAADEKEYLIPKLKGKGPIKDTKHIRNLVQLVFDNAYELMMKDTLEVDAAELKTATVHWLRHTGISRDVVYRPREHVRDDAGHASMATTDKYIESDERERHASGKSKTIKEVF